MSTDDRKIEYPLGDIMQLKERSREHNGYIKHKLASVH
jgi:hypothetical protein